ncbi:hypothetical protein T459_28851 [Capsicum annuum]|uniref:WW domain-containing protein n=1 Tax=Capsicum annuum TaxID=4072 RepID=A0A2G2YHY9_CAPAN|nr:hypothetical protein FXO37_21374 [Capsicum annuum]PHT69364.1 hypothetical protein T459_28851 [Capsicum annuum]
MDNSPSISVLRMYTCFSQHIKVSNTFLGSVLEMPFSLKAILQSCWVYLHCRNTWLTVSKVSPQRKYLEHKRADTSTDLRKFTILEGRKYYYNKVTRTSKWRMPDEVKVSSPMIETVKIKNSSEPALPVLANSKKIGIAVTLGNSVAPLVYVFIFICYKFASVAYGDGFSSENRENVKKDAAITKIEGAILSDEKIVELGPLVYESKAAKSAFNTLLESANIRSDCTWDQAMRAVINDRRYGALKSLCERKQAFNEDCKELSPSSRWSKEISIFEHDKRFKAIEQAKDREDLFEDYVEELEKKEYIRDLESEEEELRKLRMWVRKKEFHGSEKTPHGHSKKVHPNKSGCDSSRDLSVPVLIQTIRRLTKEKVQISSEVSSMLRNQVAERASAKEEASIL